jgi:hypothetical protein
VILKSKKNKISDSNDPIIILKKLNKCWKP